MVELWTMDNNNNNQEGRKDGLDNGQQQQPGRKEGWLAMDGRWQRTWSWPWMAEDLELAMDGRGPSAVEWRCCPS